MGVHIRASFTGCAIVINALSTWYRTQITHDKAKQQCSVPILFSVVGVVWEEAMQLASFPGPAQLSVAFRSRAGRAWERGYYAAMHSD